MNLSVSEKTQTILDMMKEFVEKELIPMEKEFASRGFGAMLPEIEKKRDMVRKMELWAPLHPKEYGGMGLKLFEYAMAAEVLETAVGVAGNGDVGCITCTSPSLRVRLAVCCSVRAHACRSVSPQISFHTVWTVFLGFSLPMFLRVPSAPSFWFLALKCVKCSGFAA